MARWKSALAFMLLTFASGCSRSSNAVSASEPQRVGLPPNFDHVNFGIPGFAVDDDGIFWLSRRSIAIDPHAAVPEHVIDVLARPNRLSGELRLLATTPLIGLSSHGTPILSGENVVFALEAPYSPAIAQIHAVSKKGGPLRTLATLPPRPFSLPLVIAATKEMVVWGDGSRIMGQSTTRADGDQMIVDLSGDIVRLTARDEALAFVTRQGRPRNISDREPRLHSVYILDDIHAAPRKVFEADHPLDIALGEHYVFLTEPFGMEDFLHPLLAVPRAGGAKRVIERVSSSTMTVAGDAVVYEDRDYFTLGGPSYRIRRHDAATKRTDTLIESTSPMQLGAQYRNEVYFAELHQVEWSTHARWSMIATAIARD